MSKRAHDLRIRLGLDYCAPGEAWRTLVTKAQAVRAKHLPPIDDTAAVWRFIRYHHRGFGVVTAQEIFAWLGKTPPVARHSCICRDCGRRMA